MKSTIDGAGRIVVPKPLRDALGLHAGTAIDIVLRDGRIEIEVTATPMTVDTRGPLPRLVPAAPMPPLDDDAIRTTLESTRR